MEGTARVACRECSHIGAVHGANGCRLGGCLCPEYVGPEGRRVEPVERTLLAHRDAIRALERRTVALEFRSGVFIILALGAGALGILGALR